MHQQGQNPTTTVQTGWKNSKNVFREQGFSKRLSFAQEKEVPSSGLEAIARGKRTNRRQANSEDSIYFCSHQKRGQIP